MTVPFVPAPNAVQVSMIFDYFGQQVVNVFNVQVPVAVTGTIRGIIAGIFATWWSNNQKPLHVADMKLVRVKVTSLDAANSPSLELNITPPEAGTSGSTDSVSGSAVVITHRTALRGRNYRGRTYLAGWPEGQRTNNVQMVLSYLTSCITSFGALVSAITTAGYSLVVLSKMVNKAYRGTALTTAVTGFTADTFIDSQRRRLGGRGS
jgi:hypothetical protein